MKRINTLLSMLVFIAGCSEDAPDMLRSTNNTPTESIRVYIQAESHTHLGDSKEQDETHTTVEASFYGVDGDGFSFNYELASGDQLSLTQGTETTPISGKAKPDESNKLYVEYSADATQIAPDSEFSLNLDRESEAGVNSLALTLLPNTPFSVSPAANESIGLSDEITLEWTEIDDLHYRIALRLRCFVDGGETLQATRYINHPTSNELISPLTFTPGSYFTLLTASSNFNSAIVKTSRQQVVTHNILID